MPQQKNNGFGHNSAADYLIFAKFCTNTQNFTVMTVEWEISVFTEVCKRKQNPRVIMVECENFQHLEIQDGERPASWKLLYHHISVKSYPISMKFCTLK